MGEEPIEDRFVRVLAQLGRPMASTEEVAAILDADIETIAAHLDAADGIDRRTISQKTSIWYPVAWRERFRRERVICFPTDRELVVDQPEQFTRAQLSQLAHLVATSGSGGYRYRIRPVDIWQAPYDSVDSLLGTLRSILSAPEPTLTEWIEEQWDRANQFVLETHPDDYTVLRAGSASLLSNVAMQELDEGQIRATISETEAWVAAGSEATIKRRLYDAGFPVQDNRELEAGDPIDVSLTVSLRPYQQSWVDSFIDNGSGVLVGPPGSGKTVAALGVLEEIGGETLILVPSRELASQWRERILADTNLDPSLVGEYHGGVKQLRPITVATYHVAGMGRHQSLFDNRRWGLIIFDECHHIPAAVFRRTAELQSRARLGLSASPVRGDEKEDEIFTLIGPPIGTDWSALLEAGYVIEPTLEIRYLPWGTDEASETYAATSGHQRRQAAAMNPAKLDDIRRLRTRHETEHVLIFVDWLDQGKTIASELAVPFISGEMPHAQRERCFADFRSGTIDTLVVSRVGDEGIDLPDAAVAILASGLGGSRRQGTQRVGRTMRPVGGAHVYVLATRGTEEEDFARHQLRHLETKGMRVRETVVELENDPN